MWYIICACPRRAGLKGGTGSPASGPGATHKKDRLPRMAVPDRKTRVVRLRISEADHAELTAFAAAQGVPMSELLRRGARIAAGQGPVFDGEFRGQIVDLVRQVRGVATNINQMAKAMNSGRVPMNSELASGFGRLTTLLADCQDAYLSLCARAQSQVVAPASEAGHGGA